jgi:hypothetical protein
MLDADHILARISRIRLPSLLTLELQLNRPPSSRVKIGLKKLIIRTTQAPIPNLSSALQRFIGPMASLSTSRLSGTPLQLCNVGKILLVGRYLGRSSLSLEKRHLLSPAASTRNLQLKHLLLFGATLGIRKTNLKSAITGSGQVGSSDSRCLHRSLLRDLGGCLRGSSLLDLSPRSCCGLIRSRLLHLQNLGGFYRSKI